MNSLLVLPTTDTPQISESQIREQLTSVNRKLEAQNLQPIPINVSDWLVKDGITQMYPDSIEKYISELSDAIEGENRQRKEKRKKIQEELDSIKERLRKLKQEYDTGGYKRNHDAMNSLRRDLEKRGERSPKIKDLKTQLEPLEEINRQGDQIQRSINDLDSQLSGIKIRLGEKILQQIPETFIQEIEKNLREIRIKQIKVVHIDEPGNLREVKKKSRKGITTGIVTVAAAFAVIVGGLLRNTENKGIPRKNRGEDPTLPEGVIKKSLILTKFADQICGSFENFIKNPKNLDATTCTRYLGEMIASRGGKIQGEGLVLKDAKFIRTLLEVNGDKLEFSINCSYIIEDIYGNRFPEDAKIKIHLYGRLPWPERIETNLMQDPKLKDTFEKAFLWQCQERFPPNNIYGLNIGRVKLLDQISHPENHTSRLKVEFETNKGAIVLEKDSKIKE